MHITEGIIVGKAALAYTGVGIALMGVGVSRMKSFARKRPENRLLLGMGTALVFFISLLPIPAFTGTCSHPCGTPFIGILLGPLIGTALAGISLLFQAAFFAHGGFGTWGANLLALGFCGCFFGWALFQLCRRMGLPIWAAGMAGGLIGDIMVYAASGMILGTTLATAPNPQYSLGGYLLVIYAAYLPTQLPIALAEMLITGLALHHAARQRPEVLNALGIVTADVRDQFNHAMLVALVVTGSVFLLTRPLHAQPADEPSPAIARQSEGAPQAFAGMDEAVNEDLAAKAGRPPRDPFIDTESMGDLWNLLLLGAGAVCGFVLGRGWHLLWAKPNRSAP